MRDLRDVGEPEHQRRALDAVRLAQRLGNRAGGARRLLEPQQRGAERLEAIARLFDELADEDRGVDRVHGLNRAGSSSRNTSLPRTPAARNARVRPCPRNSAGIRRQAGQCDRHDIDDAPHAQPRSARAAPPSQPWAIRLELRRNTRQDRKGVGSGFRPVPPKTRSRPLFSRCATSDAATAIRQPAASKTRSGTTVDVAVIPSSPARDRATPSVPPATRAVPMKHAARSAGQVAGGASMSPGDTE